ncbi:unnamed protein product [Adineta steineri]|uniref:Uncharacterized protein n=1 Tax=Adineta steineri TaxID=433720 RepID=A0A815SHN3_9BILA|nr:unnamed protein product [Adineta steineri]CAF1492058.1 unnamed protein product [Adineta steineri]CAF1562327.1 unnamed protein product [Adineta steineri]CAF1665276.1 unnamed protein product [Adineta steineri]
MLTNGGLWNTRKPQFSAETSKLLKTLMDESRVNNFQRRQLTSHMLRGESLPEKLGPSSTQTKAPVNKRVEQPRRTRTANAYGVRTYNDIVNSGAYIPADYQPRPIKGRTEQEKDRLAHFMAYGTDPSKITPKSGQRSPTPPRELDRFDELVLEIEERKQFLEQMSTVGKRKEYQQVISNEIADKIREMEQIDRQRSKDLEKRLKEQS